MAYTVAIMLNQKYQWKDGHTEERQYPSIPSLCSLECVVDFINNGVPEDNDFCTTFGSKVTSIIEFQPEGWWQCDRCDHHKQYHGGEYYHGTECHCAECMRD